MSARDKYPIGTLVRPSDKARERGIFRSFDWVGTVVGYSWDGQCVRFTRKHRETAQKVHMDFVEPAESEKGIGL
jgi:hypothetical protein